MNGQNENKNTNSQKDMFHVPEDYFQNSQERILNTISCIEELKEFPLLTKHKGQEGFTIPRDYFNKQTDLGLYPFLSIANKELAMTVPENYFSESHDRILQLLGYQHQDTIGAGQMKSNPFS